MDFLSIIFFSSYINRVMIIGINIITGKICLVTLFVERENKKRINKGADIHI